MEQRYRLLHERIRGEVEVGMPDASEQLMRLERAYAVLSSPPLRAEYDAALARGESGEGVGAPPSEPPSEPEFYRMSLPTPVPPTTPRSRARMRRLSFRRRLGIRIGYLAIALAIGFFVFHSRAQKRESDLRETARVYAQAIVSFERDHSRPPLLNSKDWPSRLAGPVNDQGVPYLKEVPKYVQKHPFDVIQTRSRSGLFASSESGSIQVTTTKSKYVLQYVPYGRTYSVEAGRYIYEGYLLLVDVPIEYDRNNWTTLPHSCEASGNPVQVLCDDELLNR